MRSERQLVERIDFNLLFRWFVGLAIDDRVWDHSTFSRNRERLFDEGMAGKFFGQVKLLAEWQELVSEEHLSVDGTLIDAWAAHKSSLPEDGRAKLAGQMLLGCAAINLVRIGSLNGWWDARHT